MLFTNNFTHDGGYMWTWRWESCRSPCKMYRQKKGRKKEEEYALLQPPIHLGQKRSQPPAGKEGFEELFTARFLRHVVLAHKIVVVLMMSSCC